MSIKSRLIKLTDSLICFIRKVWRPLICLNLCASVFVNLVFIPLKKLQPIEFTSASTFVGAIVAAFAVREWGKIKGVQDSAP